MATRIKAIATAHNHGHVRGRGALHLSDVAARLCLDHGHCDGADLDLLINTGIYRDHNLAEPALASIIQDDLDVNRGHPPRFGHHGTFSFDLANGGCGVVTALQLADGFVGCGTARLALIVTGDADPAPHITRGFPFQPAGGAILLQYVPGDTGFIGFAIRTFPEAELFESNMRWDDAAGLLHQGRNVVEIVESPRYVARCLDHGVTVARELLASAHLAIADVGLLIASQYPPDFATELARRLELPSDRLPRVAPELERTHTAGPIAALQAAEASGRWATARHTLFVTAGAGPTIAAALYRS